MRALKQPALHAANLFHFSSSLFFFSRSPPLVNSSRVCYVAVNEVVVDKWSH